MPAAEDLRLSVPKVRGTPEDTEYIRWGGVVFQKVGSLEDAGLAPDAFPRGSGPLPSIDVVLLSGQRAKRFRKRSKRSS